MEKNNKSAMTAFALAHLDRTGDETRLELQTKRRQSAGINDDAAITTEGAMGEPEEHGQKNEDCKKAKGQCIEVQHAHKLTMPR
jgi:hypothetical protein